ncbi:IclR family transcriptional regulator [Nocardioides marmoraquaticus]
MSGSVGAAGPEKAPESSGTQAVDRAASLLTAVVEADTPVTFGDLVEATGLARSTTSRMLAALERTGLLERTAQGEYVGGPLFVLYAARHDRNWQLAKLARPTLELIAGETRETTHLGVANGGGVEHVGQVDGSYLLGAPDWNDVEVPVHCSALGKVLLAHKALDLPDGRLSTPTDQAYSTRADLEDELAQIRERGWATTFDELELGLSGIAAPIFGPDDDVVAAVGVSGPTTRLEARTEEIGQFIADQAQQLSRRLQRRTTLEKGPSA